jgi:cytochrome c556
MKRFAVLAALACLTACSGPQTPGAKAAHERHEHFEALGKDFKAVGDELKKTAANVEAIRTHTAAINAAAPRVRTWFPAGSGPQDGVKTHALATVWSEPDEFARAAARLTDAAAALDAAAQSGDLAAVRGAMPPLGQACKACHDRFRHKD